MTEAAGVREVAWLDCAGAFAATMYISTSAASSTSSTAGAACTFWSA